MDYGLWLGGIALFLLGLVTGMGIVFLLVPKAPPSESDIARFMERVVSSEELESQERLRRVQWMRNGRKTTRFDSGPNAKVMRVRVRPVSRRYRRQK